jgi:ribonuclease P protein component
MKVMPKENALPRSARITSDHDFNNIIKKGKNIKADFFRIHFLEKNDSKSRIGVIVSRHIKEKALKNKYKRQVREYFRLNRGIFTKKLDMVVIVFKASKDKMAIKMSEMLKKEKIISC